VEPRRLLAQRLAEDVEVAHGADRGREPGEVAVRRGGEACGQDGGEEPERRAQPARGDPQLVHWLDLAGPRGRRGRREGGRWGAGPGRIGGASQARSRCAAAAKRAGRTGAKSRSAARSRRVATRSWCTGSTSPARAAGSTRAKARR